MSTPSVSSYFPSSFPCWKYDVFLSFRGDTRKNFTGHLYTALYKNGITVFRDDEKLEKGKPISLELLQAIEESRFSIIVFSRKYASSTWCLDELVHIVHCMNTMRQKVIPVFYKVDPSEVRKQSGNFEKDFADHEKAFQENLGKVETWRRALTEVANLSGFHLKNRYESEFIQDIVKEILSKLGPPTSMEELKDLIGIKSRLNKLFKLVGVGFDDVHMIGIHGMGGLGKTTIARVVYNFISYQFDGSSFLADVSEISRKDGLKSLQNQLLSNIQMESDTKIWNIHDGIALIRRNLKHKRVLIVVDDVDHVSQLEALVGKHDWFASGSRILITTRDKHLLKTHRVDKLYKARRLNNIEAHDLFTWKALNHDSSKDYEEFFKYVMEYAHGVPLVLKVLGSFLFGKTVDEWRSALERLKKYPPKDISDILQISFDGLEETEQKIFLDVACFFRGEPRDFVERILDGCGFDPIIGIKTLVDKSLVTITINNIVWMHDLLQELGKQIVYKQSRGEPGKRSRLWKEEDIRHILDKSTGTEVVESIILEKGVNLRARSKAFSNMINLRLLRVLPDVNLPEGIEYLSNELRLLHWHSYPLKSLPPNLKLDKTIELIMCHSCLEQLWEGIQASETLKYINLEGCQSLFKTPDFTEVPNLEKLILEGCSRLHHIHPSLLLHKKITFLNMRNCTNLMALPREIHMDSLEELLLSGCSKLKNFPDIVGKMEKLTKLYLKNCKSLVNLPSSLNDLRSLEILDLSGCFKPENEPKALEQGESLEEIDIRGTALRHPISSAFVLMKNLRRKFFGGWYRRLLANMMSRSSDSIAVTLPSLSGLRSLTDLDLRGCYLGEGSMPSDIGDLCSLRRLNLSKNNFVSLPSSISRLSKVYDLILEDCKNLRFLPEIPPHTELLVLNGCVSLETSSNALTLCNSDSRMVCVFGVDCPKLLGCRNTVFLMLKDYLKTAVSLARSSSVPLSSLSFSKDVFHIVVPGSEIPEWCHQNEGSSIQIKRHPHLYNNSKLIGYVVCCVFVVHKQTTVGRSDSTHRLEFSMGSADQDVYSNNVPAVTFEERSGEGMSDHTWLIFVSRQDYISRKWKKIYNSVSFYFRKYRENGLEVKRCGARPLYEQDVEEECTDESSSSTVWNLNEFPQDFDEAASDSSFDDYDGIEFSGSEYYDDEAEPQDYDDSIEFSGSESCDDEIQLQYFDDGMESSGSVNLDELRQYFVGLTSMDFSDEEEEP